MAGEVGDVQIRLSPDEALVLFGWLCRSEDADRLLPPSVGEQVALWAVCGRLEEQLVEPFGKDYGALVDAAAVRLGERVGGYIGGRKSAVTHRNRSTR